MDDRISSAKKKRITGKPYFSEGNHLAYVPISELLSTYLHSMWVLRLCQRSHELRILPPPAKKEEATRPSDIVQPFF